MVERGVRPCKKHVLQAASQAVQLHTLSMGQGLTCSRPQLECLHVYALYGYPDGVQVMSIYTVQGSRPAAGWQLGLLDWISDRSMSAISSLKQLQSMHNGSAEFDMCRSGCSAELCRTGRERHPAGQHSSHSTTAGLHDSTTKPRIEIPRCAS